MDEDDPRVLDLESGPPYALSIKQARKVLGTTVGERQLRAAIENGMFEAFRIGRRIYIPKHSLRKYLLPESPEKE